MFPIICLVKACRRRVDAGSHMEATWPDEKQRALRLIQALELAPDVKLPLHGSRISPQKLPVLPRCNLSVAFFRNSSGSSEEEAVRRTLSVDPGALHTPGLLK